MVDTSKIKSISVYLFSMFKETIKMLIDIELWKYLLNVVCMFIFCMTIYILISGVLDGSLYMIYKTISEVCNSH